MNLNKAEQIIVDILYTIVNVQKYKTYIDSISYDKDKVFITVCYFYNKESLDDHKEAYKKFNYGVSGSGVLFPNSIIYTVSVMRKKYSLMEIAIDRSLFSIINIENINKSLNYILDEDIKYIDNTKDKIHVGII